MTSSVDVEPLIRVTVAINRKKGVSEEEFHEYWANSHGPFAADWLTSFGVVKYVQYHTSRDHRNLAAAMAESIGRPVMSHDGMSDFYVRDYADFADIFLDSKYEQIFRPDQLKFMDLKSMQITVGVEHIIINDGKVVEHSRKF